MDPRAWTSVAMGRTRTRRGRAAAENGDGMASADALAVPRSVRRRRQSALLARRRRIALLDTILGALVGVLVLALGFGLAPVGMVALLVLVGCAASYLRSSRRGRRA